MFKKIETAWNSRTPVWLHNGTKENIIAQLGATVILVGGMIAYDELKDRRALKKLKETPEQ